MRGQALRLAHGVLVGGEEIITRHDRVPVRFKPLPEPILEAAVELVDLLRHEGPSIREHQDTDRCHRPAPLLSPAV